MVSDGMSTIPDALTLDLKTYLLANAPEIEGLELTDDNVRLKHAEGEPPVPRVVILAGDGKRVPGMDGTARVPISIEVITSMDRVTDAESKVISGVLDEWFRELRSQRRADDLFERTYLHDILIQPCVTVIRKADREHAAVLRGEFVSTLLAVV